MHVSRGAWLTLRTWQLKPPRFPICLFSLLAVTNSFNLWFSNLILRRKHKAPKAPHFMRLWEGRGLCWGGSVGSQTPCVFLIQTVSVEGTGQRITELGSCPCSATDRPWPSLGHLSPLYQLQWPGRRLCSRVLRAQGSVQGQHSQILHSPCSGASITRWFPLETLWLMYKGLAVSAYQGKVIPEAWLTSLHLRTMTPGNLSPMEGLTTFFDM